MRITTVGPYVKQMENKRYWGVAERVPVNVQQCVHSALHHKMYSMVFHVVGTNVPETMHWKIIAFFGFRLYEAIIP